MAQRKKALNVCACVGEDNLEDSKMWVERCKITTRHLIHSLQWTVGVINGLVYISNGRVVCIDKPSSITDCSCRIWQLTAPTSAYLLANISATSFNSHFPSKPGITGFMQKKLRMKCFHTSMLWLSWKWQWLHDSKVLFSLGVSFIPNGCIIWFQQKPGRKLHSYLNAELHVDFPEVWPS